MSTVAEDRTDAVAAAAVAVAVECRRSRTEVVERHIASFSAQGNLPCSAMVALVVAVVAVVAAALVAVDTAACTLPPLNLAQRRLWRRGRCPNSAGQEHLEAQQDWDLESGTLVVAGSDFCHLQHRYPRSLLEAKPVVAGVVAVERCMCQVWRRWKSWILRAIDFALARSFPQGRPDGTQRSPRRL